MKALVRVQAKYRPCSGDLQGMRIQAAIPNLAARKMVRTSGGFRATETAVPAFRKPFLIEETGDCSFFTEADLARFKKALAWAGYTEVEMLTDLNGRKLEAPLSPALQARVDAIQREVNELNRQSAQQVEDAPF